MGLEPKIMILDIQLKVVKKWKIKKKAGIKYIDFETFMKVELNVGKITSVEDHPNADKLMIVNVDDVLKKDVQFVQD